MAVPSEVFDRAAAQHGLITRNQLRTAGMSTSAAARVFGSSGWVAITPTVARLAGAPSTDAQRVLAAVLDSGHDSAVSHYTAARWWGLAGCSLTPLTLVTTHRGQRLNPLGCVHRVRRLPERWVTVLAGVRVVRPELLAMQLFDIATPGRAERLVERLWSMRLLSGSSIGECLDDLGERGRNGTAGLRQYLARRGLAYTPPATGLEGRTMQILDQAGIAMRRQVDSGGTGWSGRVDFRHEGLPVILEVQSEMYHAALSDRLADQLRIAKLTDAGFTVVEVWDDAVWSRPSELVASVRRAIEECRGK